MVKRILFFLLATFFYLYGNSQEKSVLIFADNYQQKGNLEYDKLILPKTQRLNSHAGKINVTFDNGLPDSIQICILAAIDLWESNIQNDIPIQLQIVFDNLESGNDIEVAVVYIQNSQTYYPSCLWSQINKKPFNSDGSPDAIIYLNSAILWDCNNSSTITDGYCNLTYAVLRGIAISLGFGSSVSLKTIRGRKTISFTLNQGHSAFDNLIFSSNGERLENIPNTGAIGSEQLSNFTQPSSDSLFIINNLPQYRLYAPSIFEKDKSLIYFEHKGSLMTHNPQVGSKHLQIDEPVKDALRAIGWNITPDQKVKIVGVGIGEDGITSAYDSHKFVIQNKTNDIIQNSRWRYSLFNTSGEEIIMKETNNSEVFTIPAIDNPNKYQININGDIYGYIYFEGSINGEEVSDRYKVSLELKPRIESVNIVKIVENQSYTSKDIYYTIKYSGSDHVLISVEEEFGSSLLSQIVNEPFLAHSKTCNVASYGYAWIDVTVENPYGSVTYTKEIPPSCSYNFSNHQDLWARDSVRISNHIAPNSGNIPSKPNYSSISYDYSYTWSPELLMPILDGILRFEVYSENATSYIVRTTSGGFNFFPPSFFPSAQRYDAIDGKLVIELNHVNWGDYVTVSALNSYGSIIGDTICSTDLISDLSILNEIETIRMEALTVPNKFDGSEIKVDFHATHLDISNSHLIKKITILTPCGRIAFCGSTLPNELYTSLPFGLYILIIKTKNDQTLTFKFTKS